MSAPTDPTSRTTIAGAVPAPRTEADVTAVRPFEVRVPEEQLADLRRRLAATRWPTRELVTDRSQGVQLATMQQLVGHWATDYDWRRCEAKLNAVPQFTTEIDGVDLHFVHVRSPHPNALPLIMTHGWPGSVVELLESIGPLTDPPAHGGRAEDALRPRTPLPARLRLLEPAGRGRLGRGPGRAGVDGTDAPARLHPLRRPGRRRGRRRDRRDGPPGTRGAARDPHQPARDGAGCPPAHGHRTGTRRSRGARRLPGGRLRLLPGAGHAAADDRLRLLDSPVALAAWLLDHDTDSYHKISRAFVDDQPAGNLTRDHILDNITLYWLTGTGASAARSYWDSYGVAATAAAAGQAPTDVRVPVGFTTFPGEIWRTPRSWAELSYPTLSYFNEVDRGGHFAAWEEPELFATEVQAAFRPLR